MSGRLEAKFGDPRLPPKRPMGPLQVHLTPKWIIEVFAWRGQLILQRSEHATDRCALGWRRPNAPARWADTLPAPSQTAAVEGGSRKCRNRRHHPRP